MDRDQVLAFRLARHGLDARWAPTLAEAARCPASDFSHGSALVALAARCHGVTREGYERAVDSGELALAPSLRAAIHAQAAGDHGLYGRALIAEAETELVEQLGPALERSLSGLAIRPTDALEEVAGATAAALADRGALTKDNLHAELRARLRPELLPWCEGCASHHVSPMLWRFAGVRVGVRLDSKRRYLLDRASAASSPAPAEAVRRYLRFYGPSNAKDFAAWAGIARAHARRLWAEVEGELAQVGVGGRRAWILAEDESALASPPQADGIRLLPRRDPYLQQLDRDTLAPDPEQRARLFRPTGGPGVVLRDGRLAGLWRARTKGPRLEIDVEELAPLDRAGLEAEAAVVAVARGSSRADVRWALRTPRAAAPS